MILPQITIDYDLSESLMRFKVDASDFAGMSDKDIEAEIADLIAADAAANLSFHANNLDATVAAIREAVATQELEDAEEATLWPEDAQRIGAE